MLIQTKGLSKTIQKQDIIKDLTLGIPENVIYGLLGANGAGKSTFLKMLVGLSEPTKGTIEFQGKAWTRQVLDEVGFLIESGAIYGNLSAWENLKVHTTLLGLPDERIEEVLAIVGLTGTGKKQAARFSMGMKQRLGIAIAILNQPKLLILDEPTNGLDPLGIKELRELIKSFKERGMTVIVSSHILSEIEQLADEIGIIHEGQLVYEGKMPEAGELEALFTQSISAH